MRRIKELSEALEKENSNKLILTLGFEDGKNYSSVEGPVFEDVVNNDVIEQLVQDQKKRNPLQKIDASIDIMLVDFGVENYNERIENYFVEYEKYLRNFFDFKQRKLRTVVPNFFLYNDGGAPAKGIDVHLFFPEGFIPMNKSSIRLPKVPLLHDNPWNPNGQLDDRGLKFNQDKEGIPRPIIKAKDNSANYKIHQLKHKYILPLGDLVLLCENPDVLGLKINYFVSADNMAKQIEGSEHIISLGSLNMKSQNYEFSGFNLLFILEHFCIKCNGIFFIEV